MSAAQRLVAGVDGCRGGWTVATAPLDGAGPAHVRIVPDLRGLLSDIESGLLVAAGVDIPIGLAASAPRNADVEARRRLGPRRSSVFPAPARRVLGARTYEEACALSRAASGKAISRQLFNILPKITELDDLVTPARQSALFEMCPELSFAVMTGGPMRHPKRTPEGRGERIAALRSTFGDVTAMVEPPPRGATRDDVLDALAGVWTARRYTAGSSIRLGGDVDETGLCMAVVA